MSGDEQQEDTAFGLFEEPEDYFEPEKPFTFESYACVERPSRPAKSIQVRLVGSHPLWAHHLWNAAKVVSDMMDQQPPPAPMVPLDVAGKTVLELGAGAALPSLVAAYNGAALVVTTDYPDDDLLENIRFNITATFGSPPSHKALCRGYIWGADPSELLSLLPTPEEKEEEEEEAKSHKPGFDLIIMSDLVFNHSQHKAMLDTCLKCLSEDGVGLVAFTHHRPHLQHRDVAFLSLASEPPYCFVVEHLFDYKMKPMFAEDDGPVEVRSTVHVHSLRRKALKVTE